MLHIDQNIEHLASKYSTLMLAWGQTVRTFFSEEDHVAYQITRTFASKIIDLLDWVKRSDIEIVQTSNFD